MEVLGVITKEAKESILEIQVNVALTGHDLGPFEPVDTISGGYEARDHRRKIQVNLLNL